MGAISGLIGTAGGAGGTGYSSPQGASIVRPATDTQAQTSYGNVQNSMDAQQALLQALQNQQGVQNQSQVYNQLQNVAAGQGPNPAQAMLNQSTGQNVSNQAALMAGQRGAASNVGLMARQAAQQGANLQQQAVGQGSTMQAQQALNAINSAGSMANTQAANQIGQTNANTSAAQSEQQNILNSIAQSNSASAGMQSNLNTTNAALAGATMGAGASVLGGAGAGSAAGIMAAAAEGGEVSKLKMADGGEASAFMGSGPQSKFGQFLISQANISPMQDAPLDMSAAREGQKNLEKGAQDLGKALTKPGKESPTTTGQAQPWELGGETAGGPMDAGSPMSAEMFAAKGGTVPAMVSPGEIRIHAKDVKKVAEGKKSPLDGEKFKGKPNVPGAKNSYANDIIPKSLNEGDIILPRSVTQAKHPHWAAHKFVSAIMANRKAGR